MTTDTDPPIYHQTDLKTSIVGLTSVQVIPQIHAIHMAIEGPSFPTIGCFPAFKQQLEALHVFNQIQVN
ncbi:hypothetical protein PGT21_000301 [Puccinia graminis f. sp. tritici]|uniref:Uncharacterized protein n=1 Tax=Puccinia graminis f. sp. tritici TaxID=56615 RepID=A0A5B0LH12_PUCGR|nr:hypothetical protein PGT21_000301 [Puccinia graminis f. sp. tritici]